MQDFVDRGRFQQVVRDYRLVLRLPAAPDRFEGNSYGCKALTKLAPADPGAPVSVLDIGFGVGGLADLLKDDPATRHWQVDGVDGFYPTCCNAPLFARARYRHIWHGMAEDIPAARLAAYDVLCLFDVIEHLDADAATRLLSGLLGALGADARLVLSTPLFFWKQDAQQEGDLERHLIGIAPASMLGLGPRLFHIDAEHLVGTFVFERASLARMARFQPTVDTGFDQAAGRRQLEALGIGADNVVYSCSA